MASTLASLFDQTHPPSVVIVVDNAAEEETRAAVEQLGEARVIYHPMAENVGPAGAAAFAIRQLTDEGYEWIYWGDDDDPPRTPDTLERLVGLICRQDASDLGGVAAVGARWDWNSGRTRRLSDRALTGSVEVDAIGAQNLILRTEALRRVGGPDPRLFFGLEEIELCLRIRRAGYRLVVDGALMRKYRERSGRLGLITRREPGRRHAPELLWRRYYVVRNYIFLMRRTFDRPDLARREIVRAVIRSLAAWGRGPRYGFLVTKHQFRGVYDGLTARMGRTVMPVVARREKI